MSCAGERFLKGSSPLQGNTWRAANGETWESHSARNAVRVCVSSVSSAGLSLVAKMSYSLHIHLSDMYFPTGTRPDLDIEQRITPIKRFLGSLIYI